MPIARIITRGYGSFSDVNELPVRGYSIGAVVVTTGTGRAVAGQVYAHGGQQGETYAHGSRQGQSYAHGGASGEIV